MFDHATNVVITGGHFTQAAGVAKDGFERLLEHVATSAFHNSAQRIDPPRCHESTRQAVLQEILGWITRTSMRDTWIAWLNGAAGAGKSAICQSVAEICIGRGILVASFFFSRTDPTRDNPVPLAATLAYQIVQLLPDTRGLISDAIKLDPLLFTLSFGTQLQKLVIEPLRQLERREPALQKLLVIIDGVDECTTHKNQLDIIQTFAAVLSKEDPPIVVLVSGRSENHLQSAFRSHHVSRILLAIPLDDHYLPEDDIRLFLDDKFVEIKSTHTLTHLLSPDWPEPAFVQEIVDKSSGQFIYASIVINFVSHPRSHPAHQLDVVRGLRPSGLLTPFAHLDALYRHIFSQVQDLKTVTRILAYWILGRTLYVSEIASSFDIQEEVIYVAMSDLTSVISCADDRLRFLHASLPDFLLDETRSQEYYINPTEWSTDLSILFLSNGAAERLTEHSPIVDLLKQAKGRSDLQKCVMIFNPTEYFDTFHFSYGFLHAVQSLNFNDGGQAYQYHLNHLVRYLRNAYPEALPDLQKKHDISPILDACTREEGQLAMGSRNWGVTVRDTNKRNTSKKANMRSRIKEWITKKI